MTTPCIEEMVEEFNNLHTASIAIQSGMMVGNNTEKECLDAYERLEQFFIKALTQAHQAGYADGYKQGKLEQ